MQNPSHLLLLAPENFGFNSETAQDNYFQKEGEIQHIAEKAKNEHGKVLAKLKEEQIPFDVIEDEKNHQNPDALFLNNWFNVTPNKQLFIYPMKAKNRQREVTSSQISKVEKIIQPTSVIDLRNYLDKGFYCEGTGALIFDYAYKTIYANISQRCNEKIVNEVAEKLGMESFKKPIFLTLIESKEAIFFR